MESDVKLDSQNLERLVTGGTMGKQILLGTQNETSNICTENTRKKTVGIRRLCGMHKISEILVNSKPKLKVS
jgi:hypothetical protein